MILNAMADDMLVERTLCTSGSQTRNRRLYDWFLSYATNESQITNFAVHGQEISF